MRYLQAIHNGLREQDIVAKYLPAGATDGNDIIEVPLGEHLNLTIEQVGERILMSKFRMRPKPKEFNGAIVVGHPELRWEQYWDREYELADPHSFAHAMHLVAAWVREHYPPKPPLM